jgi:hypothetical protein
VCVQHYINDELYYLLKSLSTLVEPVASASDAYAATNNATSVQQCLGKGYQCDKHMDVGYCILSSYSFVRGVSN